jgi:hypothetical protein
MISQILQNRLFLYIWVNEGILKYRNMIFLHIYCDKNREHFKKKN